MADYLTFDDIHDEVCRAIKDYDQSQSDLVKMIINMVYLNEVMVCDKIHPLYWMMDLDDSLEAQAPSNISAISKANPGVITTSAAHNLSTGDLITIHSAGGMTELNDRIFQVTYVSSTTFSIGVNTSSYTTYTSGGTVHHRGLTLQTSGKSIQNLWYASWQGYHPPMAPITPEDIEKNSNYHWKDVTQRPERYYFGKSFTSAGAEVNQIMWHPGSDANYKLRYWFEKRASKLVNNTDVPLLPPQFHHMIVAGAIMRLAESEVQVENQVVWPHIYNEQLETLKLFNQEFYEKAKKEQYKVPYLL